MVCHSSLFYLLQINYLKYLLLASLMDNIKNLPKIFPSIRGPTIFRAPAAVLLGPEG
jgi:hypothetical protein